MTPVLTTSHDDFNPRSPHGERLPTCVAVSSATPFQSTLPARGATSECVTVANNAKFQSTLPARGATQHYSSMFPTNYNFNPRSPHGERLLSLRSMTVTLVYFNPRSPHGERRRKTQQSAIVICISIHAPRTGSDVVTRPTKCTRCEISIHAPRTGSDAPFAAINPPPVGFQSTLPARGATDATPSLTSPCRNFNPRSPHGERPSRRAFGFCSSSFQSTLPARGATLR